MVSELWVRNSHRALREVIAAGENKIVFDAGYCIKKNFDPIQLTEAAFRGMPFELIVIYPHGACHYDQDHLEQDQPIAVYPVWDALRDPMGVLEQMVADPVGADRELCSDNTIGWQSRPVFGQEHRVMITHIPDMRTLLGKTALRSVAGIMQDYPEVKMFVHGLLTFMPIINLKFHDFDIEPYTASRKCQLFLPNGRFVRVDTEGHRHRNWIAINGYSLKNLHDPNECMIFNVKAVRWATLNAEKPKAFAVLNDPHYRPDPDVSDLEYKPRTVNQNLKQFMRDGDMVECNTCSLRDRCRYYRQDSICTLPGSEMSELSRMFESRDTKQILTGLSKLTAISAERAERAVSFEEDFGLDPEATKILKQTFEFAERLAKLNDPMLRMTVNVNRNQNVPPLPAPTAEQINPGEVAREAIEYYGMLGIDPPDITSEMMRDFIQKKIAPPELEGVPIDAEVIND